MDNWRDILSLFPRDKAIAKVETTLERCRFWGPCNSSGRVLTTEHVPRLTQPARGALECRRVPRLYISTTPVQMSVLRRHLRLPSVCPELLSTGAFLMPLFSGAGRAPGPGPGPFLEVPPLPAEDIVVALLP